MLYNYYLTASNTILKHVKNRHTLNLFSVYDKHFICALFALILKMHQTEAWKHCFILSVSPKNKELVSQERIE